MLQKYSVQWYPGHIARAERQLKSQLKLVDVVLEVRDARYSQRTAMGSAAVTMTFNLTDQALQ